MTASKLGTKHECSSCGAKFYDLGKPSPICPKCGTDQKNPEGEDDETQVETPPEDQELGEGDDLDEEEELDEDEAPDEAEDEDEDLDEDEDEAPDEAEDEDEDENPYDDEDDDEYEDDD